MLKRIFKYLLVAIIAGYTLFAVAVIPSFKETGVCKGVLVNIDDNGMGIISSDEVTDMLNKENLDPTGKELDKSTCCDIELFMNNISLIEECIPSQWCRCSCCP